MREEEQLGMPPLELMQNVLEDNRSLLRLLRGSSHGTAESELTEPRTNTAERSQSLGELFSTYREVLELLEILSATSGAGRELAECFDVDTSEPASAARETQ